MMKKIYSLALGLMMMASGASAQTIQLPEPNKNVDAKLMDVLQRRTSVREFSERAISDATLSQLLWAACGVNREDGRLTVPSAINAQDIKLYVVRKDGAFLYLPKENQLQKVTDKDLREAVAGFQKSMAKAPVSLVMVSDLKKFGNRKDGAKLMGTFDAAYVSENICLACTALGLATVPRMMMDAEALKAGLSLTETDLLLLNNPVGWAVVKDIYGITVRDGDGKDVPMRDYKGKVMLIVNTATRCGFTPQYNELEALYEKYHAQGLEILDFPCNQFGQQAPGTIAEIHSFCTANFNIKFPQFDKIDVNGPSESHLFTYLKSQQGFGGFDQSDKRGKFMHEMLLKQDKDYAQKSDIKWNFTKFLVDRNGKVVKRFEPTDKMENVDKAIKELLQ